jgi:hypothetical protein
MLLFLFWLFGELNPTYQLITGVIAGCIGLYVGGWITARVMNSQDVWFSAFNGLLVGGASVYFLIGITPIAVAVTVLSFVFAGLGGYTAIQRLESKTN